MSHIARADIRTRSDLDLDDICRHIIAKELNEICAHPPATVDQFIFVPTNEVRLLCRCATLCSRAA